MNIKTYKNEKIVFEKIEIDNMKQLYNDKYSYKKIADLYGCSKGVVMRNLKDIVTSRDNHTKCVQNEVDSKYFKVIDNERKAYWLGFIYGDGWISEETKYRGSMLGINLIKSDIEQLEKFKFDIAATHRIKCYENNGYSKGHICRIIINNKEIVNDLKKYGMIPNKTDVIGEPTNIPEKYIMHFIRGFFDADGCITISNDNGKLYPSISFCKTLETLNFIVKHLKYDWNWYQRKENNENNKTILLSRKNQVIDCLNKLYGNATVYLERKYHTYLEVVNEI